MQDNIDKKESDDGTPAEIGLPAGTKIGKYEIVRLLGVGAQSVVYLGKDQLLDRPVAIKQISANLLADARFLKRFRAEARILAQLGREGVSIVSVFDLLENEQGMFIAMEYVDGRTLKEVLHFQKYALPVKIAGEILRAVSSGLKTAHKAGIVHRDIKPGNIMVTREHEARIMDFGVAARSGEDDSLSLGTTKYMAPEVFKGAAVDVRADIYSLGVMAYEMLTGREFFDKLFADIVADSRTENLRWMKWHCDEKQLAEPLVKINPLIDEKLSDVIAKMMAKNPEQRYATVDDMLTELEPALQTLEAFDTANADTNALADANDDLVRSADLNPGDMDLIAEAAEAAGMFEDEPTGKAPPTPGQIRKRTVTLVLLVAAVLLVGVVFAVRMGMEHRDHIHSAGLAWQAIGDLVNDARSAYDNGDVVKSLSRYEAASFDLEKYMQEYGDLPEGTRKAQAWHLICQASIAMLNNDTSKADADFDKAIKLDVLQRNVRDDFSMRLSVRSEAAACILSLERALANKDFERIEQLRARFGELRQPPKDLYAQAELLFDRCDAAARQHEYEKAIRAGDEALSVAEQLAAGGELQLFQQAAAYLNEADDFYRKAATLDSTGETMLKRRTLESSRLFLSARSEYLQGLARKVDLDEQIRLATRIFESRAPDDATRRLLDVLIAKRHYMRAEAIMGSALESDMIEARNALRESVRLNKTTRATEALNALEHRLRRTQLLSKAANMRNEGLYSEQLVLLRQAAELGSDDALEMQIAHAQVEAAIQTGENYRKKRNWAQALEEYEKARKLRMNDGALASRIDMLVNLLTRQRSCYEDIDDGKKLLDQKEYERASRKLSRAITEGGELGIDLTGAEGFRAEAVYHANVARALVLLAENEPKMALRHLKVAAKNKETPEVQELIKQAQNALNEQVPQE